MASTTSNTASCPFQPTERERALLPSLQRGQTPRYLVHVYTSEALDPTDSRLGRLLPRMDDESHDMFQASYIATAETVNAHLRGSHGPESRGTLRSWTTSLLFAINYALYRHDTDPDRPTMDHLHIVVVDTQQWAAGTFLHARDAMQFFAPGCRALQQLLDTELAPGSDRGHHIGEYLTQGVVYAERGGAHASLQTLIDHGLFELFPALRCHRPWSQLAERTSEIRRLYDHFDGTGVQERHVVGVIALAEAAFGGCYTVPVASMLLAFKGRVGDNPVILAEFRTRFSVGDVMQLSPQDVVVEHGASELRRWRHLIHALHREFGRDQSHPRE